YAGTRATWSASAGFGSSQGGDGWSYEFEDDGGARSPGRHMWGTWTWPGWVSPSGITARTLRVGGSVSTIRTWTAPAAGEVTIEDSAFLGSDVEGEIEVEVAIEHDGETLASASLTAGP